MVNPPNPDRHRDIFYLTGLRGKCCHRDGFGGDSWGWGNFKFVLLNCGHILTVEKWKRRRW